MERKEKAATFPQFVDECIRNHYTIERGAGGRFFRAIGGNGRTVEVHRGKDGVPAWCFVSADEKFSRDWGRALKYLHRTPDEEAWRRIEEIWL